MVSVSHFSTVISILILTYSLRCQPAVSIPLAAVGIQCTARNKNPCTIFPDLCSAGGGLCVVKGPCEYQCVCPPDGRVARDCTSDVKIGQGTVVDSLLIFPDDLFWDVSHPTKQQDLTGSTVQMTTIGTTTTVESSVTSADIVTTSTTISPKVHSVKRKSALEGTLPLARAIKQALDNVQTSISFAALDRARVETLQHLNISSAGHILTKSAPGINQIMPADEKLNGSELDVESSHSFDVKSITSTDNKKIRAATTESNDFKMIKRDFNISNSLLTEQNISSVETLESEKQLSSNLSRAKISQNSTSQSLLQVILSTAKIDSAQRDLIATINQTRTSDTGTSTVNTLSPDLLKSNGISLDKSSVWLDRTKQDNMDLLPKSEEFPVLFRQEPDKL